jgi:peptidoglycan hydrolase CwlO-like protein
MPSPPEFVTWIEGQRTELRMHLQALESGTVRLQRRAGSADKWIDETSEEIARLRRQIADLEWVLDEEPTAGTR